MSQTETKRSALPDIFGAFTNPEKRLAQTFDHAKELVAKHPGFAMLAAAAIGVFAYEEYKKNYEERTGKKHAGMHAVFGDVQRRFENDPDGLKGEVSKAIDGIGNYMKAHRKTSIAVAIAGPALLEWAANRLDPKAPQGQLTTSRRRK